MGSLVAFRARDERMMTVVGLELRPLALLDNYDVWF
jgi:hypothetical protein